MAPSLSNSSSWTAPAAFTAIVQASPAGDWHPQHVCWMPGTPHRVACYALPGDTSGERQGNMSESQQAMAPLKSDFTEAFRYGPRNLEQEAPAFDTAKEVEGFYFFDESPRTRRLIAFPYFYDPCRALWSRSGKSATLNVFLPAIIREHNAFGVGRSQELLIFRLDMTELNPRLGYAAMLRQFLDILTDWCEQVGIKLDDELEDAVTRAFRSNSHVSDTRMQRIILRVLRSIKTPTIFLIDELQAWFYPLQPGTNNEDPTSFSREFWKKMTLDGNPNILWAATGSGMALVYASLNLIPTAGTAIFSYMRQVSLPAAYSEDELLRCAEQLQEYLRVRTLRGKLLPTTEELVRASKTSVATMAAIAREWVAEGNWAPFSVLEEQFLTVKLLPEGLADWSRTLSLLSPRDRMVLLGLCDYSLGGKFNALAIGLQKHLMPYVEEVPGDLPGRFRLASPLHRAIMRVAIKEDGQLRGSWLEAVFSGDLSLDDDYRALSKFAGRVSEGLVNGFTGSYAPLQALLQEWADELRKEHADHLTWSDLEWFKLVLDSQHNNFTSLKANSRRSTAEQFRSKLSGLSAVEVLAYYHRMVRNCLAYAKELEEDVNSDYTEQVLGLSGDDIKVIKAWPFAPPGVTPKDSLLSHLQKIEMNIAREKSSPLLGSSDSESSGPSSSYSASSFTNSSSTVRGGNSQRGPSDDGKMCGSGTTKSRALGPPEIGGPYGAYLLRSGALSRWPRG